jgi:predicted AlkP superfamily pyrophosphatase or phosphodiesterase
LGHQDDRPYEVDLRGYGRTFPHQLAEEGSPLLPTQVLVSPYGDQLTLDFATALIEAEGLGQDAIPDYLSISFSGVDAVNHFFGPSSLENEDMVLHLDRTLAELITFIKKTVGLKHTLIVLSADHGMAEMPEYMTELGFEAGRLYPEEVIEAANAAGEADFGIENVVKFFFRPYLYLEDDKIRASKHSIAEVRRGIARTLTERSNIALAVSGDELQTPQSTELRKRIKRNHHPQRSGDIYVAQKTYWFNFEKGPIAAMHGSPWNYDTHVPIIFAGANIPKRVENRLVHPTDVAPTLSALLGMTAPAAASGTVLSEVFSAAE